MRLDVKRSVVLVTLVLSGVYIGLQVWSSSDGNSLATPDINVDTDKLFYNRVSKSGSTTLNTLIHHLSKKNEFKVHNSKIYNERLVSEQEQDKIAFFLASSSGPAFFERHLYFLDFPKYGYRPPLYINLVRDPVERLISTFSYRRQTAHLHQTKQPSDYWLNKKYENCVRKKDPECLFLDGTAYDRLQITFFCGQFEECKILNHPWALQHAKNNIARSYAVVGVVEEWNMTLAVLEDILPQFFRGAARIYHEEMPGSRLNPSEPKFKQEVSQQVKDLVKANLSHEYELYNFALQRLHQQYRSIRNF